MTSDTVPEPLIGQSLGRYQILALLGQDALGFSYKAHDVEFQREVAVTVVDPRLAEQADFEALFSQTVRTAIGLRHPGLVKVFDFGQARSLHYVVMEYLPSGDLYTALHGLRAAGTWLALWEAVQIVRQVCLALDYLRRNGVPHRSVEPSHIFLKLQPGDDLGYQPVLADLGLAELRPGGASSLEDLSPSELTYLSPEQVRGEAPDAHSSVYSSGVLLYQLAVARPPFRIGTAADAARYHAHGTPSAPRSIRADLPESIERIILKALEKDRAHRFADAGEMARALAETLQSAAAVDARLETRAWAVSLLTQLQPGGEELPVSQTPATVEPEIAFTPPLVKVGFTRADGSAIDPGQIRFSPGEHVGLFVEPAQLTVVPGNSVTLSLMVFSQAAADDRFTLSFTGVPTNWIPEPLPAVELAPGAQAEAKLTIRPPRSPQSRAGRRALTVRVASQNEPDEIVEERVTLNIVVYSEFSSDLRPQRVRAGETARVVVHNHGNTPENFRLACFDPAGKLAFEPAELSLTVPEGQGVTAEFIAGLRRRRLFGGTRADSFLARIVAQSGQAQTHTGEVISAGLIPVWIVLPVLVLMFAGLVVAAAALIFSPPAPSTSAPPVIQKAFSNVNGLNSTATFTLTNPNAALPLTGVAFTDTFPTIPGAMVVANPPNAIVSTGCGAPSLVADVGSASITFVNGTIAASGTCTLAVDVTVPSTGTYDNTTGPVTSIEGGTGDSASAILTVGALAPPSIAKSFSLTSISSGGVAKLTFTIVNPNGAITLTGVTFTDVFPATPGAMTVANPPNPSISAGCGLPSFLPEAGSGSITFSNGTIAGGEICTVAVDVTALVAGTYTNVSGAVVSANGGTGNTATAVLTVGAAAPPSITKSFTPNSIVAGMKSTLTFAVTNPNTGVTLNGVAFGDTFPTGMVVASPPNPTVSAGCGQPTFSPVAGSGSVAFSNGTIAGSGVCTVAVDVTAASGGTYANTSSAVASANGGTGNTATAALTVAAVTPPSIAKSFAPNSIVAGAKSTLTFTVTNPNASVTLNGVAFGDTFPAGMVVANPPNPNVSAGCGLPAFAPTAGSGSVAFSNGTIAGGGVCTVKVDVTVASGGTYANTSSAVTSTNGGTGNAATAALTVTAVTPPSIAKSFGPSSIVAGAKSTLTFTITNPNAGITLMGVTFTDVFPTTPGAMVVADPLRVSVSAGCGQPTFSPVAGSGSITFSNGAIAGGSVCTVAVDVTAASGGTYANTSSAVTSANGGTGNTATAALTVAAVTPPSIAKSFAPNSIVAGAKSTLTFAITNPNALVTLTGVAFSDTFPANVVVANPPNASVAPGCGGGTLSASAGNPSVSFSGGAIAAGATCTIAVDVTATTGGTYANASSPVTSANGGASSSGATATLMVQQRPMGLMIEGLSTGTLNATHAFTVTVTNTDATVPMTYTWEATGQASPITHQSLTLSDTAVMSWTLVGDHIITVTAQNAAGVVSSTHSIAITPSSPLLFGRFANELLRGTGGATSSLSQKIDTWSASSVHSASRSMLPGLTPSIDTSGPIPRALAHVPQVATSPRRASVLTMRSTL